MDDALHDRQADARALVLLGTVQALEHAKQLARILHVEPHSVVFHLIDGLTAIGAARHLNRCRIAGARELQGVGEQIGKDLLQEGGVGDAICQVADLDGNFSPYLLLLQVAYDLPHEVCGAHSLFSRGLRPSREKVSRSSINRPICWALSRTKPRYRWASSGRRGAKSSTTNFEKPSMARSGARRSCATE